MKPATTLKEILKPPFKAGRESYCANDIYSDHTYILRVTNLGFTKKLRDELREFVVAALNEKWERDFGELVKRVGGRIVGIRKQEVRLIDGLIYDNKLYEILADDYWRSDLPKRENHVENNKDDSEKKGEIYNEKMP